MTLGCIVKKAFFYLGCLSQLLGCLSANLAEIFGGDGLRYE